MVLDVGNHVPSEVPINGENQPGGQNQTCPGPTTGASQNEDLLRRTLIAFSDSAKESAVPGRHCQRSDPFERLVVEMAQRAVQRFGEQPGSRCSVRPE